MVLTGNDVKGISANMFLVVSIETHFAAQIEVPISVAAKSVVALIAATLLAGSLASSTTGAAGTLSATAELAPAAFPATAVDGGLASILVGSAPADVPPAACTALPTAAGAAVV